MQNQQTARQKVEAYFSFPSMKQDWNNYFGELNSAGKITAKSLLDIISIILTSLDKLEVEAPREEILDRELPKELKMDIPLEAPISTITEKVTKSKSSR